MQHQGTGRAIELSIGCVEPLGDDGVLLAFLCLLEVRHHGAARILHFLFHGTHEGMRQVGIFGHIALDGVTVRTGRREKDDMRKV